MVTSFAKYFEILQPYVWGKSDGYVVLKYIHVGSYHRLQHQADLASILTPIIGQEFQKQMRSIFEKKFSCSTQIPSFFAMA